MVDIGPLGNPSIHGDLGIFLLFSQNSILHFDLDLGTLDNPFISNGGYWTFGEPFHPWRFRHFKQPFHPFSPFLPNFHFPFQ